MKHISAILTPDGLPALRQRDLNGSLCVVFDVLRATSTFVTALQHGARQVIPVSEISEALAERKKDPAVLLAGERDGVKISAAQTGGADFDLGNSPREFETEIVRGKTIVATTTNGTRALNACQGAHTVLAGSFLNLAATARFILKNPAQRIVLVCAGTGSQAALEDVLGAGALCERLLASGEAFALADSAVIAWRAYREIESAKPAMLTQSVRTARGDARPTNAEESMLAEVMGGTDNGRRLMAIPELRADVAYCAQTDVFDLVAWQSDGGLVGLKC